MRRLVGDTVLRGIYTIALLLGVALPFLAGCHSAPSATAPVAYVGETTSLPVQTTAVYRSAEAAYARRDYAAALTLLNRLAAAPNASTDERAFLVRQQALCQKALKVPTPVAVTSPSAFPAPTVATDCGPRALKFVCDSLRIQTTVATLATRAGANKRGTSLAGLSDAARSLGLKTQGVQMDRNALAHLRTPAIAWWQGDHFVAVLSVHTSPLTGQTTATIHDPNKNGKEEKPLGELLTQSGGVLLTVARP